MPRPVPPTLDPAMVAAGLKDTAIVVPETTSLSTAQWVLESKVLMI